MFIKIFLKWHFITITILALSILLFYLINTPLPDLEEYKCPACYETDLCPEFYAGELTVASDNLTEKFVNMFSIKNTMFADWYQPVNEKTKKVVLKKLAQSSELSEFDEQICKFMGVELTKCDVSKLDFSGGEYLMDLEDLLVLKEFKDVNDVATMEKSIKSSILCPGTDLAVFLNHVGANDMNIFVWYTLHINPEPIILQIFKRRDGWPVAHYFGACGRYVVEEYCGKMLHDYKDADWFIRADLTHQLLQAAIMFTNSHSKYRMYLLDISSDNIAVDSNQRIRFIDLENILLQERKDIVNHHVSEFRDDDEFTFSKTDICSNDISDINFYGICKFLLSKNAPWPMMSGGLLHSIPTIINAEFPKLLLNIENCVNPNDGEKRYEIVLTLLRLLEKVLNEQDHF